ncbi:hypothetical protein [Shinella oryzae]|uniref:Uncharacterized protein n=1 Tax=Shinella oryzae TaxID=2871820 RepID=A0ABY9K919_9HYPH|nr:hypothetical protein [Shinella oryzae]WLS04913.1 hypothetical protein Q9315_22270 [Shinella oryzae]WLS05010.1 hypothetical protein Q9315_22820 [Shinella oryzae]WLS05045.1 hypothetical protein Q9315_23005 [Shinella oryzae]
MMTSPCPVYLFRSAGFAPSGDTVVSVAPLDCVVAVYGNGGVIGEGGLSSAFGGAAVFKNDASGDCFVGVWGARNASRFRKELRAHMQIAVHKEAPDARLSFWEAEKERPKPVRK